MEFVTKFKEALNKETIKKKIEQGFHVRFDFPNKDFFMIGHTNAEHFIDVGIVDLIEVIYGTFQEYPERPYNTYGSECFPVIKLDEAIDVYLERLNSETPKRWSGKAYRPEDIKVYNDQKVFYSNHYLYLEHMLDYFWKEVFGKTSSEMRCDGIIISHGDKCYSYRNIWLKHGINHNRGSLIWLLSYTKEFEGNEKHKSKQWVVDNYQKYLPMIERAEALVLENIFIKKERER